MEDHRTAEVGDVEGEVGLGFFMGPDSGVELASTIGLYRIGEGADGDKTAGEIVCSQLGQ